ncbi:MAG: tRNA (adenosine(37)-N6)-threonylcarbamoyltransferase complex dimerization subunit type 1 TsaB [Candidatus Omnitrophota bacterium]|jgi:tRNA threonylcarbamoyladenosine biosynthesis protein TsaB|nr:MAG: tRNA (adenosine(37)-N6)-threonylcarbamoyltransferase complex dimerization subunit type 1 TsaB [Candidatus Omnitrophota bacterium]
MRILGIDTSSKNFSLGLFKDGRAYSYNLETGAKLSGLILEAITETVNSTGCKIGEIDYFACGLGPGSFTGIRIGVSVIKALSWSLRKPSFGFSSLDVIARNMAFSDGYIAVVTDAKRGLVYHGLYRIKDHSCLRVGKLKLANIDSILSGIKHKCIFTGDAISFYKEKILNSRKCSALADKDMWYPKGHNIINLCLERVKKPFKEDLNPIYLYPENCQVKRVNVS